MHALSSLDFGVSEMWPSKFMIALLILFSSAAATGGQQLSRAGAQDIANNSYVRLGSFSKTLPVVCEYPTESANASATWYRPDGAQVLYSADAYEKGSRQQTIADGQAVYRDGEVQAGVYRCVVEGLEGGEQHLFAGIYYESGYLPASEAATAGPVISGPILFELVDITTSEFQLVCTSVNSPATIVEWTRNGDPVLLLHGSSAHQRMENSTSATYENVLTVIGRESGVYMCNVTTQQNDYATKTIGTAMASIVAPSTPTNVTVIQTDDTALRVSWNSTTSNNGTVLLVYYQAEGAQSMSFGGSTTKGYQELLDLQVGVNYTITVIALGTHLPSEGSTATITLVPWPPSPPVFLIQQFQISITSIFLVWEQPLGDNITGYELSCSYSGPCNKMEVQESPNITLPAYTTHYSINGLEEFSSYIITIVAVNGALKSSGLSSLEIITLRAAPSAAPRNVSIATKSPTEVTITWIEVNCVQQNSEILKYSVEYGKEIESGSRTVAESTELSFTAVALTPATQYSFEVAAVNNIGQTGVYSPPLTVSTDEDVPGPVHNLVASVEVTGSVLLMWEPPLLPNGVITHYSIRYQENSHADTSPTVEKNSSTSTISVKNLTPLTLYTFSVAASTTAGYGVAVTVLTTINTPTVQNVLAVSVNSTAVLVAWDAVEVASVLRYTVYYERVEGDQRGGGLDGSKDFPTSATFGIITGLSTGLQYSFQVTVFVEVLGQAYEGGRLEGKMAVPQDVQMTPLEPTLSTSCTQPVSMMTATPTTSGKDDDDGDGDGAESASNSSPISCGLAIAIVSILEFAFFAALLLVCVCLAVVVVTRRKAILTGKKETGVQSKQRVGAGDFSEQGKRLSLIIPNIQETYMDMLPAEEEGIYEN